ncbi:MAG: hypothetical protein ACSLEY_03150 [Candidatus Saccharimonadales bacterium]
MVTTVILVLTVAAVLLLRGRTVQVVPGAGIDLGEDLSGQLELAEDRELEVLAGALVDTAATPDLAYAKALALLELDRPQESVALFGEIVSNGKSAHDLRLDYARAAMRVGDQRLAIEQLELAAEELGRGEAGDDAARTSELHRIENLLFALREPEVSQ